MAAVHGDLLRRRADPPLVVDLGFGASPVTTVELHARLRRVRPDVRVVGLEIDPERVAAALPAQTDGLAFARGGFELAGLRPLVVRAMNVLRQYEQEQAAEAWRVMCAGLAAGGMLVEGTCDEVGRRAVWVELDGDGPRRLVLAAHLPSLGRPGELAERLPKVLIARNVPGEGVHALLRALDEAWDRAAPYAPFGPRARWAEACSSLTWPGVDARRARLGELAVPWATVAPS